MSGVIGYASNILIMCVFKTHCLSGIIIQKNKSEIPTSCEQLLDHSTLCII